MAERMQVVIQISNGGGVAVVYAELLAVVYSYLHLAGRTKHRPLLT